MGAPIAVKGVYLAVAPVLTNGETGIVRVDTDSVLLTKSVGGGGAAYGQGLLHPVTAAQQATILDTLPIARYNSAGFTLADTQGAELQCDSHGRLLVSDSAVGSSSYTSAGDATSGQIVAGAGRSLRQIYGFSNTGATRYLMFFDALANPANGTVPFWTALEITSTVNFAQSFGEGLIFPASGIRWVCSTTRTTLTIAGAANFNISALFD